MAAPEDNTDNGGEGMLKGHGVGVAIVVIFAGMALVVAAAASDGAIFGLDLGSVDNNAPVISDAGSAGAVSRDVFDEGSGVASTQPESNSTLSEEEKQLLAISDFPWNSIAGKYISSQDILDRFSQPKPVQPEPEPLFLNDEILVDIDRDRAEAPADVSIVDQRDENEQLPDGGQGEQQENPDSSGGGPSGEDNSGSGSDGNTDQSGESGEGNPDNSGSGSNSTNTNSTGTQNPDNSGGTDGTGDQGNSTTAEATVSSG